jgi:tRNA-Thr(GGU) m(6)t(6)A37 methyltransferase TsaA
MTSSLLDPKMTDSFNFQVIGTLQTPFKEKFGVPRQSLMMTAAKGILTLKKDPSFPMALRHLEQFSHIWLIFVFHKNIEKPWHPLIDTPRIAEKMGVFATRSPHRPNSIGISAVRLEKIDWHADPGIQLHLSGLDLLDETPVLDIKPYLPFADRIEDANSGWIKTDIERFPVSFSPKSTQILEQITLHTNLQTLIEQMLELDPRPTSQRRNHPISAPESDGLRFAFRVLDYDIRWMIRDRQIYVEDVVLLTS